MSSSNLTSPLAGPHCEHHRISRIPKSGQEQKDDFDREPTTYVYQYMKPTRNQPGSTNMYKTYERGSLFQCNEEEHSRSHVNFSQYDEIPGESSLPAALRRSKEDCSKRQYSSSHGSDQLSLHDCSSPDEIISSQQKRRDVFYSQSGEAHFKTPKSGVLQKSRIDCHGEKFSLSPAEHYTHYYSDWSVVSASQATPNVRQSKGDSRRSKCYRRDVRHDIEISSSGDESHCTKSSRFRSLIF